MNHKAVATCPNGHSVEWGACQAQVSKLFGGTKACGAKLFKQQYADGTELTVSFDDTPWSSVECVKCHTVFESRPCPECGTSVPVSDFKKAGLLSKLG